MADLKVDVVAADRTVWSGAARSVVVPAVGGELGILKGHEPVMAVLAAGEVRVASTSGDTEMTHDIEGGFVSVDDDYVTVVIDTPVHVEA